MYLHVYVYMYNNICMLLLYMPAMPAAARLFLLLNRTTRRAWRTAAARAERDGERRHGIYVCIAHFSSFCILAGMAQQHGSSMAAGTSGRAGFIYAAPCMPCMPCMPAAGWCCRCFCDYAMRPRDEYAEVGPSNNTYTLFNDAVRRTKRCHVGMLHHV